MVGYGVIQIARTMGLRTINVHRDERPRHASTQMLLNNLGGDINIPESFMGTPEFREIISELPPIKLALNGAGGECVSDFARVVGKSLFLTQPQQASCSYFVAFDEAVLCFFKL